MRPMRLSATVVPTSPTYKTPYLYHQSSDVTPLTPGDQWEAPRPSFDHQQRPALRFEPGAAVPVEVWDWTPSFQDNPIYMLLGIVRPTPEVRQVRQNLLSASGRLGGLMPNALGNRGNLPRGRTPDTMETSQPGFGMGDW